MLPSLEKNLVNERKFSGPLHCGAQVLAILRARCAPDDWFATGTVNSIYYDTPGFGAYWEKANGDNIKTKIRVRWYGNDDSLPDEVPVFVEFKGRIGSARNKIRFEMTVSRDLVVNTPFEESALVDFLYRNAYAHGVPISQGWRPVCCISYSRMRFFDTPSMSRVSFDWNIQAKRFNRLLFPWASPVSLNMLVCEFKNNGGEPPIWAEHMLAAGLRFGSFSKYGECMERLITGES